MNMNAHDYTRFEPLAGPDGCPLPGDPFERYLLYGMMREIVTQKPEHEWQSTALDVIDQLGAGVDGPDRSLLEEARAVIASGKSRPQMLADIHALTPIARLSAHPSGRPTPARVLGYLTLGVFFVSLSVLIVWSQLIDRDVRSATYAAWTAFRNDHCEQVSLALDRVGKPYPVFRCDDGAAMVVDRGVVPDDFDQTFAVVAQQARCAARAKVLPWRTACSGRDTISR